MNPVTLIVSLAVLIGIASAQVISPPVAPYFGPLGPMYPGAVAALGGLGLGLGGMGIAGLAGMAAFGPLGPFGPLGGLGFGLGSFGPLGNARLGGIRGRRALDEKLHGKKNVHGDIKCELTASLLNCTGPHEIIQCEIESFTKVPIEIGHFKVNDFVIREKVINKVESLKIMPKKVSGRVGHKLERLAIFDSVKLAKSESGFWVKDAACFSDVLAIVKELPDKIKLTLTDSIVSN